MKFVFVSNYLNHHQIPFCRAMYERMEGSFAFIQTQPIEQERLQMGWNGQVQEPYLRLYYEQSDVCRELIRDAEVLLFGGTDDESYIQERLREGKLILRYTERIYKTGQWKAISPRGLRRKFLDHTRYRRRPVYMLCAGAYVPSDFHIVRAYPGKMYCWGYFPETKHYDLEKLLAQKGYTTDAGERVPYLLWSGRMIDWKHPELVLKTAKHLMERGLAFHLDMIGGGGLETEMKQMAKAFALEDRVSFLGFLTPEGVRSHMERADIYLLTSDRQEGWGAVANEAMNSGCAMVADHMVGAAPYLIRQGRNGMIYRDGQEWMLFSAVEALVREPERRRELGREAYETIVHTWNAEHAADALCALIHDIQAGKEPKEVVDGTFAPCQPAPVIPERKMYEYIAKEYGKRI